MADLTVLPILNLDNRTDYDTGRIADLIAFATQGIDLSKVGIMVTRPTSVLHGPASGYARNGKVKSCPWYADTDIRYEIVLRLGSAHRFPAHNVRVEDGKLTVYGGRRSPQITMRNWQEGLIRVAAHEAWHIVQCQNHTRHWEYECERHAAERLEAFRTYQDPATMEAIRAAYAVTPLPVPHTDITKGTSLWAN